MRNITVFEREGKVDREYDVFSRLLKDRIIFVTDEIETHMANTIIAQLLFLDADDNTKPIYMYINSPGGEVYAGLAVYDTMRYIKSPVHTTCIGMACSMAADLLIAGEPGKRSALPNSMIMIHQPSGGVRGQETDIQIEAALMKRLRLQLDTLMSENTGLSLKQIKRLTERDTYLTPEQALELNIIDKITKVHK